MTPKTSEQKSALRDAVRKGLEDGLSELGPRALRRVFESRSDIQNALASMIREYALQAEEAVTSSSFPTWVSVKIGTGLKIVTDFGRAFKEGKYYASQIGVGEMLKHPSFTTADVETDVELVKVTPADLDFAEERVRYKDVCTRALQLGFAYCTPEVTMQLRLQCPRQPGNEVLLIGMEGIPVPSGGVLIFSIESGDSRGEYNGYVGTYSVESGWNQDVWFVFQRTRTN